MSNIYIKILIHVYVYYCNSLVLKKLESLKWGSFLVVHYKDKYLKNEGCFYHRIKPLSKCLTHNTKLKCNNIKTLYNRLVDLLVAFSKIESFIDTSTILSTQGWINSIATSHSKMGSVLKVWTKPRRKRRQRGWNWHTFQPTCLPPTMVRIIILKTDTSRVIIKYRPTKTNPKYFLPENCHLNGPI